MLVFWALVIVGVMLFIAWLIRRESAAIASFGPDLGERRRSSKSAMPRERSRASNMSRCATILRIESWDGRGRL